MLSPVQLFPALVLAPGVILDGLPEGSGGQGCAVFIVLGQPSEFFENPLHPYTQMLLSAIPVVSKEEEAVKPKKMISAGEVPSPVNTPPGCSFHPRCPSRMDVCCRVEPATVEASEGHTVKCHLFAE